MTEQQYKVGWALAAHFGHVWTRFFGPEDWVEGLSPEVIRETVNQALEGGDLAAFRAPVVLEDGSVHHVTGTNRVEWFIDPAGVVDVFVHRPMKDSVLLFVILPDGRVTEREDYHSHILEEMLLPRHVWAGNEVIQVVLGGDFRELHPALTEVMRRAVLSAREAARKAADRLRKEVSSLVPDSGAGDEEWRVRRIRQVRDALNETRDLAVVEACAQILGV